MVDHDYSVISHAGQNERQAPGRRQQSRQRRIGKRKVAKAGRSTEWSKPGRNGNHSPGMLGHGCLERFRWELCTFLDPLIDYWDIALVNFVSGQRGRITKTAVISLRQRPV